MADTRGRQSSLDLTQSADGNPEPQLSEENYSFDTFKSLENDSQVINQQQKSLEPADQRSSSFERGANSSFERVNSSFDRVNSTEQTPIAQQLKYGHHQARASVQIQSIQKIDNQLLQRRRSSMTKRQPLGQRPSLTTPAPIALPRTLDSGSSSREQLLIAGKLPRKSYSASDSSLDELLDPTLEQSADAGIQPYSAQLSQTSPHPSDDEEEEAFNLAGTARSRSVHQLSTGRRASRRSNTSPLAFQQQLQIQQQQQQTAPAQQQQQQQYTIPAIHTTNEIYSTESNLPIGKSSSSTMLTRNATSSSSIRRPTSARIRKQSAYFTYETSELNQQQQQANQLQKSTTTTATQPGNHLQQQQQQNLPTTQTSQTTIRRQSDSQGSEGSEPVGDNSLSLSSPDYSRSPRQSADSDILGLRMYRSLSCVKQTNLCSVLI